MPALVLPDGREFAISYNESNELADSGWIRHCEECSMRSSIRIFHVRDDSQVEQVLDLIPERVFDHLDKDFCPDNQEEL